MTTEDFTNQFELVVPGNPHSLALIRAFVREIAENAGFDDNETSQIEVAVDEACSNVVEHAYAEFEQKPDLVVHVFLQADSFVVQILDEGTSFDIESYEAPTFPAHWEEGHVRGIGVYLMHEYMDTVDFGKSPDKRNQLRMVKKRHSSDAQI